MKTLFGATLKDEQKWEWTPISVQTQHMYGDLQI